MYRKCCSNEKISSEMEVAPGYKLCTLLTGGINAYIILQCAWSVAMIMAIFFFGPQSKMLDGCLLTEWSGVDTP